MLDQIQYTRCEEVPGLILSDARIAQFHFESHFHLDYHIGIVTAGVHKQVVDRHAHYLTPGSIQLMPPGEVHDDACPENQFYFLKTFRVPSSLFEESLEDISGQSSLRTAGSFVLNDQTLADRFTSFHDAIGKNALPREMDGPSEWLSLLAQLFVRADAIRPHTQSGQLSRQQLKDIRDFCEANLDAKISLEMLAAVLSIEKFAFLRLFKKTLGMTPHAWLIRLRLEHACVLLRQLNRSCSEVAHEVGFYDQSHFNHTFLKAFGVPPSKY